MATTTNIPQPVEATDSPSLKTEVLICLPAMEVDDLQQIVEHLSPVFSQSGVVIAHPNGDAKDLQYDGLQVVSYTPAAPSRTAWVHTAADYLSAYKLMQNHSSRACILLGSEAQSFDPHAIQRMVNVLLEGSDLALPRYDLGPYEALVNMAILAPVSRALYSLRLEFPLAVDIGFSIRMAERLAMSAQKFTAASQDEALIWPAAEAAFAGFSVAEVAAGSRILPHPDVADLTQILTQIAGSLFADAEAKASYWQRSRPQNPVKNIKSVEVGSAATETGRPEVSGMIETYKLGYKNLHEIWSLVLPPNSLLGLKKLSLLPAAEFRMPDALWVRIVYDFLLAFRLRTINRTHLLGALTPLYLACVASYLIQGGGEKFSNNLAAAFEADKPYLVSRWRWPDRFNP